MFDTTSRRPAVRVRDPFENGLFKNTRYLVIKDSGIKARYERGPKEGENVTLQRGDIFMTTGREDLVQVCRGEAFPMYVKLLEPVSLSDVSEMDD